MYIIKIDSVTKQIDQDRLDTGVPCSTISRKFINLWGLFSNPCKEINEVMLSFQAN